MFIAVVSGGNLKSTFASSSSSTSRIDAVPAEMAGSESVSAGPSARISQSSEAASTPDLISSEDGSNVLWSLAMGWTTRATWVIASS